MCSRGSPTGPRSVYIIHRSLGRAMRVSCTGRQGLHLSPPCICLVHLGPSLQTPPHRHSSHVTHLTFLIRPPLFHTQGRISSVQSISGPQGCQRCAVAKLSAWSRVAASSSCARLSLEPTRNSLGLGPVRIVKEGARKTLRLSFRLRNKDARVGTPALRFS